MVSALIHMPSFELCIPLTGVNALSLECEYITHKTRTFSRLFRNHKIHLSALFGLFIDRNDRFPYPFHTLQLVKFLAFHIPET